MRLYDYPLSGNGYKVRLLLSQLGTQYQYVTVDILAGAARTPEFLARNPLGKVPILELDDGRILPESNADISLYAYTHLAHEGGIDLEPFAAIGAWLARVRAQPKYVGIERRP